MSPLLALPAPAQTTCEGCGEPIVWDEENPYQVTDADWWPVYYCCECFWQYHCYCPICDDYPHEDTLCPHLFWSDRNGLILGCGDAENDPEDLKADFFAMLAQTGLSADFDAALRTGGEIDRWGHERYGIWEDEDWRLRCEDGWRWLYSLDFKPGGEYEEMTRRWIAEFWADPSLWVVPDGARVAT